jgi:hypothetical protein
MPSAFGCQYTSNYSFKRALGDKAPLLPSWCVKKEDHAELTQVQRVSGHVSRRPFVGRVYVREA